ncbi:hypothetical protein ACA910_007067 [Epithemia clementina (nom. ined.)]
MRASSLFTHVDEGDLVTVDHALTECEASWVQALVDCLHEEFPLELPFYQERPFGENVWAETYGMYQRNGGNYVTFLGALLPRFLPGVVHSLYMATQAAYELAHWGQAETFGRNQNMYETRTTTTTGGGGGLPHPLTLGIRSAEYLHYRPSGRLGQHADTESMYTVSIPLSDPNDYEGGWFHLEEQLNVYFKPRRLSALVFFSEALHGLTPITAGTRHMLVTELWPLDHVPFGFARPTAPQFQDYLDRRQGLPPQEQVQDEAGNDWEGGDNRYYYGEEEDDDDDDKETYPEGIDGGGEHHHHHLEMQKREDRSSFSNGEL